MKLSPIEREHILYAADEIDNSSETFWSEYWIHIHEKNKAYPFKQLIRKAFTNATGIPIGADYFQSNDGYRDYIKNKFGYPIDFKVRDNIPFFTENDIAYFAKIYGQPYESTSLKDQDIGECLRKTIFSKTNTWVRALNLEGFEIKMDNSWQRSGYFAKYSWARIFRKGQSDKKIFFTVGVSAEEEALIYKLDCQYRSYNHKNVLDKSQVEAFNRIVNPTGANWMQIPADDLVNYSWEKLIDETRYFIEHYTPLYDEAINAVWNLPINDNNGNSLRENPLPKGLGQLPTQRKPSGFSSPPDYDSENEERKKIGELGESLVKDYERAYLNNQGKADLADKICKVPDFEGYDILSFYPDGKEKYIEVKTTTGSVDRPFFWTWNEKLTMQQNPEKYVLYRLYNYDKTENSADFFILSGDISEHILEEAIQYRVYIK